ncbi:unnamed protein product [Prorocentrum cordatum]|uniref:Palmitoyltransferase n=1 Tax=Prorocentrum cordatum TaxID=2364126 RepID=A0ABN9XMQ1_9DINO|nr:unnamed protein product [Polarella glacialis]
MLVVCYAKVVLTGPGEVPDSVEWKMGESMASSLRGTREVKTSGQKRHCKWCLKYKPDRCHHCRMCKVCVLKMDHHCPWVANCIGFRNHKYFFLLVIYSELSCLFIALTVLGSVVASLDQEMPTGHRFLLAWCATLSVVMGVLLGIFLSFHSWLMLSGLTTIEFCEKGATEGRDRSWTTPRRSQCQSYDRGLCTNVLAVLGPRPLLWLLPCSPPAGDGVSWGAALAAAPAPAAARATDGPAAQLLDSDGAGGRHDVEEAEPEAEDSRGGPRRPGGRGARGPARRRAPGRLAGQPRAGRRTPGAAPAAGLEPARRHEGGPARCGPARGAAPQRGGVAGGLRRAP